MEPESRKGNSSQVVAAAAFAAVVLIALVAALEYSQLANLESQNKSLSSSYSSSIAELQEQDQNSTDILNVWLAHVSNLDSTNVTAVLADYAPNATMVWSGTTEGMGGTYTQVSNIRLTLQTFLGGATNFTITIESFNVTRPPSTNGTAGLQATFDFAGTNHILGNFDGQVVASYLYAYQDERWLISQEDWNFKYFDTEFVGTDTTFPQWQLTGSGPADRSSESPFKNWVYNYGGAAAAVLVAAYLASLPLAYYIRKKR